MLFDEEILAVVQRLRAGPSPISGQRLPARQAKSPGRLTRLPGASVPTYLDHLAVERGLSPASVEAYRSDLRRSAGFSRRPDRAAKAPREDLRRYLTDLRERGLSARSAARALSAVRGFYGFAGASPRFQEDPTADIVEPPGGLSLPKSLSEEEVEALLAAPDASTPLGLRDRAMLELIYASGLRVSEIVSCPGTAWTSSRGSCG